MNRAFIMFGLPGCGKSFYIKKNFIDYKIVNPDKYIDLTDSKPLAEQHANGVRQSIEDILYYTEKGTDFVIDATNINLDKTPLTIAYLQARNYMVTLIFIDTSIEKCLENNRFRPRTIPESVIFDKEKIKMDVFEKLSTLVDKVVHIRKEE